ncbi:MAG TPA: TetR/AcrR family transcriptional regulator [Candidatus Sulfotelmatobacter sp.]|jgi:TetR/AcrR family transcriptional repressor of mexJK operon|nr:TetR/AcrR family transcriptional regulator [Candidatus Sulfotelmatobacter sp.]
MSKQDAILAAAQTVFLESGYAAASMDTVASKANVSKATIYAHFANKRALFEAMIAARCEVAFAGLQLPAAYDDAEQALYAVAIHFIKLIQAPEALALHRVIMGEAPRLPEVGEAFYSVGPVRACRRLRDLLSDLTARGLLSVPEDDIPIATLLFLGMIKGDTHLRAVLGLPADPGISPEKLAAGAAAMLVARYGKKP